MPLRVLKSASMIDSKNELNGIDVLYPTGSRFARSASLLSTGGHGSNVMLVLSALLSSGKATCSGFSTWSCGAFKFNCLDNSTGVGNPFTDVSDWFAN